MTSVGLIRWIPQRLVLWFDGLVLSSDQNNDQYKVKVWLSMPEKSICKLFQMIVGKNYSLIKNYIFNNWAVSTNKGSTCLFYFLNWFILLKNQSDLLTLNVV